MIIQENCVRIARKANVGFCRPTEEPTCEIWRRYLVSVCGDELGEDVADRAQRR